MPKQMFMPHGRRAPCLSQRTHLYLRLLWPEVHVHLALHHRSGSEVFSGLFLFAGQPFEFA